MGCGGELGSLTVTAWSSSAGVRTWVRDLQGVEAPWPLSLAQKYTQRDVEIRKTPIYDAEHREEEDYSQGRVYRRAQLKPFGTFRGLVRRSRTARGGGGCAGDGGRKN